MAFFVGQLYRIRVIIGKKKERKDHAIHFRPLCLVVYPTYFVSIERAVVRTGILLYDPRCQNDLRNRALDDQLDRLRVDESISGS